MIILNFFTLQRRKTNPQDETDINAVCGYPPPHTHISTNILQQNDGNNLPTAYWKANSFKMREKDK